MTDKTSYWLLAAFIGFCLGNLFQITVVGGQVERDERDVVQKWAMHEDDYHKVEVIQSRAVCVYVYTSKRTSSGAQFQVLLRGREGCQ